MAAGEGLPFPPFCFLMKDAAKIVASAVLGADAVNVIVNNKVYVVEPPTIRKLAGAGLWLSDLRPGDNVGISEVLKMLSSDNAAHALSWFIAGDESLTEEFLDAPFEDVVLGIEAAYSLVSTVNFLKLSTLARNVAGLIARQKR